MDDQAAQQKAAQLGMEFMHFGKEGKILKLIPEAIKRIGNIAKLRKRKIFGSKSGDDNDKGASFDFRGIDDALNGVSPILAELGITPSVQLLQPPRYETLNSTDKYNKPTVINRADVMLAVTYMAEDGSWVRSSCAGMATDTNDNTSSNKAHSAAAKYAIFLGLMIPVDRMAMEDGDADEGDGPMTTVERASNAVRSSNRPGDSKSEEITQSSLVAMLQAFKDKDRAKIAELMTAASNNAKFNEAQRGTIIKTGKDYLASLNKPQGNKPAGQTTQTATSQTTQHRPAGTKPATAPTQQAKSTTQPPRKEGQS